MNFGQWLGLISLIISIYIIWQIKALLLLIFAATILATGLNRITHILLRRFGIKRKYAIILVLTAGLLIFSLFLLLVLPPFIEQFEKLSQLLPRVGQVINLQITNLRKSQFDWLPELPSSSDLFTQFQPLGTEIFRNFVTFFSNSFVVFLQILLLLILTLMFLINPQDYRKVLIKLFPSFYRKRADEIFSKCEIALVNWLTGIIITSIFIGCLSGVGLWGLQIEFVLVHSVLAGLLNFIPNIGPTLSVASPILITIIDSPWKIIPIVIWYFIVQNLESYLLTPTIMSKQVSLLPAVTLMAQIFFAALFGPLGLLLALPLTVVAKTWIEELLFKDILDRWNDNSGATNLIDVEDSSEKNLL